MNYRTSEGYIKQRLEYVSPVRYIKELETEIEKLNYIIDKQDKDIKTLSKGNKRLKNKINKAIKYIKEPNRDEFDYSITYLLEILQGGDE